jgi:hypothetical protein
MIGHLPQVLGEHAGLVIGRVEGHIPPCEDCAGGLAAYDEPTEGCHAAHPVDPRGLRSNRVPNITAAAIAGRPQQHGTLSEPPGPQEHPKVLYNILLGFGVFLTASYVSNEAHPKRYMGNIPS